MDWISGVYCNSGANTIVLAAYYLCFYLLSNTLTILIHVHVNNSDVICFSRNKLHICIQICIFTVQSEFE